MDSSVGCTEELKTSIRMGTVSLPQNSGETSFETLHCYFEAVSSAEKGSSTDYITSRRMNIILNIIEKIGVESVMGDVYASRIRYLSNGGNVVVKMPRKPGDTSLREEYATMELLARLRYSRGIPNFAYAFGIFKASSLKSIEKGRPPVMGLLDYSGYWSGVDYLVMENIPNPKDPHTWCRTCTVEEFRILFIQLTNALYVAGETYQFMHQDLHSGNVLVSVGNPCTILIGEKNVDFPFTAYIIDFGMSRYLSPVTGEVVDNYKTGQKNYSGVTDLYRFILTIYKMFVAAYKDTVRFGFFKADEKIAFLTDLYAELTRGVGERDVGLVNALATAGDYPVEYIGTIENIRRVLNGPTLNIAALYESNKESMMIPTIDFNPQGAKPDGKFNWISLRKLSMEIEMLQSVEGLSQAKYNECFEDILLRYRVILDGLAKFNKDLVKTIGPPLLDGTYDESLMDLNKDTERYDYLYSILVIGLSLPIHAYSQKMRVKTRDELVNMRDGIYHKRDVIANHYRPIVLVLSIAKRPKPGDIETLRALDFELGIPQ